MGSNYKIHEFNNGIRLVYRYTASPVAHAGIVVNAGSRDELPEEQGLAHFIEHMIFKGTTKRSAYQVINRLENVGADLNAFTTKEETCVYASVLSVHLARAIGLLSEIICDSVFPEKELVKEKAVVLDEINSYKDNPAEWIHDEFDEQMFPGHPLGRNILGTAASLKRFRREHLQSFIRRMYRTDQTVISVVCNLPFNKVVSLAGKYLGSIETNPGDPQRIAPGKHSKSLVTRKYGRHQAHLILGNLAYNYRDEKRIPMALLNNMLGGPAMNSRLNLALRERNGIAYNLESSYQPLSDTGLFTIYLGTDEKMVGRAIELVNNELNKLRSQQMGVNQLRIAKEQLKGQLAISVESGQSEMISMSKSVLVYNKVDTIEEICCKIDAIESSLLMEVANEIIDPDKMSTLIFNNQR